jgi:hypothetical protein
LEHCQHFSFLFSFVFWFSGNVGNPEARHCGERDEGVRTLKSTYNTMKKKHRLICCKPLDVSVFGIQVLIAFVDPDSESKDQDFDRKGKWSTKKEKIRCPSVEAKRRKLYCYFRSKFKFVKTLNLSIFLTIKTLVLDPDKVFRY